MAKRKRPVTIPEQTHNYRKFSTLLRQDIYGDLHQIRINKSMSDPGKEMHGLYLIIEEALEQYVIRELPAGATARKKTLTSRRQSN